MTRAGCRFFASADNSENLTIVEEAAALMESLANNHPFIDGNKRIAFAAAHTFLLMNGHDLAVEPSAAADFVIRSLDRGEFRFGAIRNWTGAHLL